MNNQPLISDTDLQAAALKIAEGMSFSFAAIDRVEAVLRIMRDTYERERIQPATPPKEAEPTEADMSIEERAEWYTDEQGTKLAILAVAAQLKRIADVLDLSASSGTDYGGAPMRVFRTEQLK